MNGEAAARNGPWDPGREPPAFRHWRSVLLLSAVATALALVAALAGARTVRPGVPPWPRFWATAFFVLLLWPVGLSLVGRLVGLRVQGATAALLLAATVWQQSGLGSMPLPLVIRWKAILVSAGDAIRQRILLPDESDRAWQRAWRQASRAAVVICTWEAVSPEAGITVTLNNETPVLLASLPRSGKPADWGWYALPLDPLDPSTVHGRREVEVVVRRERSQGPPALFCGGQDDPGRAGAGGSARWLNGRWSSERLADQPLPLVERLPALGRYYVELRFYDAEGRPSLGIWY